MNPSNRTSAVEFPTPTRLHVAVAVRDVAAALPFYRTLFGQEPTKLRTDYAKFEVLDPPVNFSLNASAVGAGHGAGPQHFGIQVKSSDVVEAWKSRVEAAGFAVEVEAAVTCCYAVQDKFWVEGGPTRYEVYTVLAPADSLFAEGSTCCGEEAHDEAASAPTACCGTAETDAPAVPEPVAVGRCC